MNLNIRLRLTNFKCKVCTTSFTFDLQLFGNFFRQNGYDFFGMCTLKNQGVNFCIVKEEANFQNMFVKMKVEILFLCL